MSEQMTPEQLQQLLLIAIAAAIVSGAPDAAEPLPRAVRLCLRGQALGLPRTEPTLDQVTTAVLAALRDDRTLPSHLAVSVAGIEDGKTLIEVSTETWIGGDPPRTGPFTIGDLAPSGGPRDRHRSLSRGDLADLAAERRATWRLEDAWPQGTAADERRRLWHGPHPDEEPSWGTDKVVVRCPGNAKAVLVGARQVLDAILFQDSADWPSDERWRRLLPGWFVAACAPEPPSAAGDDRWTVSGFTYWFKPEEREWYWWDATLQDASSLEVLVAPSDRPYSAGALKWLFQAVGASSVETAEGV